MNKSIVAVLVLAGSFLLLSSQDILGKEPVERSKGTITTTGTASDSYPPDTAEISLAVETTERTVTQATEKNSRISGKVINALKSMINEAQGDVIKTSSYSVQPKYEYDRTEKKNRLIGYTVMNQIAVKTKNTEAAGQLIDRATEQGANRIQSINFTISDDKEYCKELLDKATQRGKFEAEVVAQSLGTSLAGIKSVTASCSGRSQPPIYPRAFAQEAVASKSAVPIESGSVELTGSVSLGFFILNSD